MTWKRCPRQENGTCLTQSPYGNPAISSAVVTCPSSLVENWSSEFMSDQPVEITHRKWLGRDKLRCIVINEKGSKAEEKVKTFVLQSVSQLFPKSCKILCKGKDQVDQRL